MHKVQLLTRQKIKIKYATGNSILVTSDTFIPWTPYHIHNANPTTAYYISFLIPLFMSLHNPELPHYECEYNKISISISLSNIIIDQENTSKKIHMKDK